MQLLSVLFDTIIKPRSLDEDTARKEFIFNVFITATILLFFSGLVANLYDWYNGITYSMSIGALFVMLSIFCGLYLLSRRGFVSLASFLLISIFFFLASGMGYLWGVDVSAGLLFYALTIVMAGILISAVFAFTTTILISISITFISYLHSSEMITADRYWTHEWWNSTDIFIASLMFAVIATVSWLSNREIERSLKRARHSEAALKEERNLLEVRVVERTQELRQAEMENISQAYRFVEFGRLAGGIFHDLMNPLTAISLNIENEDIRKAKQAALHMQKLMETMRRHIASESAEKIFPLHQSIEESVALLGTHARSRDISLITKLEGEMYIYGDQTAFAQVITNIISNAIDSYSEPGASPIRVVEVSSFPENDYIVVCVRDHGSGMTKDILDQIFKPFFTTKTHGSGLGIGLPLAQRIVEKKFGGKITVDSSVGTGSIFKIYFKIRGS